MQLDKFKNLLQHIYRRTDETFDIKRDEYANDVDVFKSLKNGTAFSFQSEPEQVAWNYLAKHLESIQSILSKLPDEEPSVELINEKLGDAINYLIIIEGLLRERKQRSKYKTNILYLLKKASRFIPFSCWSFFIEHCQIY